MDSLDTKIKVKIYTRTGDEKWVDLGNGNIAFDFMEKSEDLGLFVFDEVTKEAIIVHQIRPDEIYRREEDTIISWKDPLVSTEYALSFQEASCCTSIWDSICHARRASGTLNNDTPDGVDSESWALVLPDVTLATLPLILKIVEESGLTDRIRLTDLIILDQGFFQKLMDLFRDCEDHENLDSLHMIYNIVKGIIMLDSLKIFERIFGDELIMDIIGCLEYDPEVSHVRHRDFLKEHVVLQEAIPIKDTVILSKIHQTYRIGYLKDVVLPGELDDEIVASLDSIVHENNCTVVSLLKEDKAFIKELFSRLRSSNMSPESRRNLACFLLEFCTLSKNLQTVQQHQLFRDLVNEGLFNLISDILQSEDKRLVSFGPHILILFLNQDPNLLRSYVVRPEGTQLLGHLVQGMLTDFEDDMHYLFLEFIRTLLDSSKPAGSESDPIIDIFYDGHLGQLVDVIASSCSGGIHDVAEASVAAGSSIKQSKATPEILMNICGLLCFCVAQHPYRIKCSFILNNFMEKVLLLTRRKEKYLVAAAVRFVRAVVICKDESVYNEIGKRNLLKPVVDAFVANGNRYNLLHSTVLSLFEFIRKLNLKPLLKYIVESFWGQLVKFESLYSIQALKVKYEQSLKSVETKSEKPVEERGLDKEDEDYFNKDSDEKDAKTGSASCTHSSKQVHCTKLKTLSSKPVGLVDYSGDEDDEDFKPPHKRQTDASQEDEYALESLVVKRKLDFKDSRVATRQRIDRSPASIDRFFASLRLTLSQTVLPNMKAASIAQNVSHTSSNTNEESIDKDNQQDESTDVVTNQSDEENNPEEKSQKDGQLEADDEK